MTIEHLKFLRRVGLDPEQVEILEELPKRLKLRDLRSGAIFYIPKEIPKRLGEKNEKGDIDMSQEEMNAMDNEVAGVVNGKKLTALSWVTLVSGKTAKGGREVYTLYVDIIDASLNYERTLVITATVNAAGKVSASAAFAK